jgi:hypothetical protein
MPLFGQARRNHRGSGERWTAPSSNHRAGLLPPGSRVQRGLGYVGDNQLDLLDEKMAVEGVSPATHTLIAVLHHHLLAVSASTLNKLAGIGVGLVLLGHHHVGMVLTHYDADWGERPPLHVAAAGSCGLAAPNMLRHFFLWEIDDNGAVPATCSSLSSIHSRLAYCLTARGFALVKVR